MINLPHRKDRLDSFMTHWDWIGHIQVMNGAVSDIPHTGCGLAHINAIRKGLELNNADWCLVLEDDAKLNCSRSDFLRIVKEATHQCSKWDAVMLGPNSHRQFSPPSEVFSISPNFIKVSCTKSIRSCTGMLWSKNALPLIQKYYEILNQGYIFPIDRMLTSFKYPWMICTDEWNESPNAIQISILPNVWISSKVLVFQEPGIFSDNTYAETEDFLSDSVEYMKELVSKAGLQVQSSQP